MATVLAVLAGGEHSAGMMSQEETREGLSPSSSSSPSTWLQGGIEGLGKACLCHSQAVVS